MNYVIAVLLIHPGHELDLTPAASHASRHMHYTLKRHPIPVTARFRHSLVLTYAFPQNILSDLLPPGLELDGYGDLGFVAIAMVQTEGLRPSYLPAIMGQDFFLAGYRVFARYTTAEGKNLRGLRILRSDTDRKLMKCMGNLLTHYNYHHAKVRIIEENRHLEIKIQTPQSEADLHVVADIGIDSEMLPGGSPFASLRDARRFAGPLPFTFDYESQTHSVIRIHGKRGNWHPRPVPVRVLKTCFFKHPPFDRAKPVLANAFHIQDIPYRWERGIREVLPGVNK